MTQEEKTSNEIFCHVESLVESHFISKSDAIKHSKVDDETAMNCYNGLKSFVASYDYAKRLFHEKNQDQLLDAFYELKHSFTVLIMSNLIFQCYTDRIKSILDRAKHVLDMSAEKSEKSCEKKIGELQDELYDTLVITRFRKQK